MIYHEVDLCLVNRLRLMVISLQGYPAGKLQLQHVSHKGKLTSTLLQIRKPWSGAFQMFHKLRM